MDTLGIVVEETHGIAAGAFTKIVEIVAPSSAVAGATVAVTIKIKNTYTSTIGVSAVGVRDSVDRFIDWPSYNIPAGATHSFSGSFTMPNSACIIHAYSYYYGTDSAWHFDDEMAKNVSLSEVFEGTISKKELEYDGSRANIPAYDIPENNRGLVHIWGRNDMSDAQRMGIWWQVKDPDGVARETYAAWETWPYTGGGSTHEFIGGRFDLDKPGIWTIAVQLFMNPSDQVVVDDYYGNLCTVKSAIPEPTFRNFGVTDYSKR